MRSVRAIGILALLLATLLVPITAGWAKPARFQRPTNESWSDGPTLYWKHKVSTAGPRRLPQIYRQSRVRLKALQLGSKSTIPVNEDLKNYLAGAEGKVGAVQELRGRLMSAPTTGASTTGAPRTGAPRTGAPSKRLYRLALSSRQRLGEILARGGIEGEQRNLLAELMVWRNLAYNSSTLAHGSFGPDDPGNAELQTKARDGLNKAIAASFKLGRQLGRDGLHWRDISHLQGVAIEAFPEKEPGMVRSVNFAWPVNSFGVHWPALHGNDGLVGRFGRFLDKSNQRQSISKNPLGFMAKTLYWLHNVHAFRDGNGRTEVLLGWSLAKAAGYPLPLDYDQTSGDFKLAATKWGGTRADLKRFIARGAVGTERFARRLVPLLRGSTIVSNHTDHGAVGMVTSSTGGQRHLLVMFPVTHARRLDDELRAERGKNRVVLTGSGFDPKQVRIQIAIDGKHNAWQTVTPSAVNRWNRRYPWWTTVEPIYKVALPAGATYVNFRVINAEGEKIGADDYYMKLNDYQNINSRIGG